MDEKKKYAAPAVEKALDILELMISQNRSFTMTELSNELDVSPNSVFRILKEFEDKHFVQKNPLDSSYVLTSKLYYLASGLRGRNSLVSQSQETMMDILRLTSETVLLTTLTPDFKTLIIDQLESPLSIKFLSTVGYAYPSHSSAMGKCLLAYSGEEDFERYLAETTLEPQTPNTIRDKDQFRKVCQEIRKSGVAYDNEESVSGLTCIACPVLSAGGILQGAIGISALSFRLQPVTMLKYEKVLKDECATLSRKFGWSE